MTLSEFQRLIERTYFERDSARGVAGTFMWFAEEVGELASALRQGVSSSAGPEHREATKGEFADVCAWLFTLASVAGIEMEEAVRKYENGCPRCGRSPCTCSPKN